MRGRYWRLRTLDGVLLGGVPPLPHTTAGRCSLLCWLIVCVLLPASAQGQTVELLNLSRPGAVNFYVGESWQINVTGSPYQQVAVTATHNGVPSGPTVVGSTDGSGRFTLNGSMSTAEIGSWTEVWTVGGVQATPTLSFEVLADGCSVSIDPNPLSISSVDHYSGGFYQYSDFGTGKQTGSGKDPYCAIAYTQVTNHEYLHATVTYPSLYKAEAKWEDVGGRIPPFYPFVVDAFTYYFGVDLRSWDPFAGTGIVGLIIIRHDY